MNLFPSILHDKHGYVDSTGKIVLPHDDRKCFRFRQGIGTSTKSGLHYIHDSTGRTVGSCQHELEIHSDGFLVYGKDDSDKDYTVYGAVNVAGDIVIPAKFASLDSFSSGRSVARTLRIIGGICGLIDIHGDWILEPKEYDYIHGFSTDSRFSRVAYASPGAIIPSKGNTVINRDGDRVNKYTYNHITCIRDGYMGFRGIDPLKIKDRQNLKYGVCDYEGNIILPEQFNNIGHVQIGKTFAVQDSSTEKWGVIDFEGQWVIEPKYTLIIPKETFQYQVYEGGYIDINLCAQKGKWGVFNVAGEQIVDFLFDDMFGCEPDYSSICIYTSDWEEFYEETEYLGDVQRGYLLKNGTVIWEDYELNEWPES